MSDLKGPSPDSLFSEHEGKHEESQESLLAKEARIQAHEELSQLFPPHSTPEDTAAPLEEGKPKEQGAEALPLL